MLILDDKYIILAFFVFIHILVFTLLITYYGTNKECCYCYCCWSWYDKTRMYHWLKQLSICLIANAVCNWYYDCIRKSKKKSICKIKLDVTFIIASKLLFLLSSTTKNEGWFHRSPAFDLNMKEEPLAGQFHRNNILKCLWNEIFFYAPL